MIHHIFNEHIIYALSWTIIHSLWQVTLIAIFLGILLSLTRKWQASTRYNLALGSLMLAFGASVITFISYLDSSQSVQHLGSTIVTTTGEIIPVAREYSLSREIISFFEQHLVLISNMWLLGSVLFLLKFFISVAYVRKIYKGADVTGLTQIRRVMQNLLSAMNMDKKVLLGQSSQIDTPMVIGFLKPMVLFPVGVINQLTMGEVESILAHELAHIKRNDFIINLIQSIIETLFYFNPGVWYISSVIRSERENCCDDIALQNSGQYAYANVLVKLEELKQLHMPKLAMTLSRDKHSLQNRVKRILQVPNHQSFVKERIFSLLVVLFMFLAFTSATDAKVEEAPEKIVSLSHDSFLPIPLETLTMTADTIPSKSESKIVVKDEQKEVEVKVEDGEVIEFKLNGENIDPKELEETDNTFFYKGDKIVTISPNGGAIIGDLDNAKVKSFRFDSDSDEDIWVFESEGDKLLKMELKNLPEQMRKLKIEMDDFEWEGMGDGFNEEELQKLLEKSGVHLKEMEVLEHIIEGEMDGMHFDFDFDFDEEHDGEKHIFKFKHKDGMGHGHPSPRVELREMFPEAPNGFHFFGERGGSSLADKMSRELNRDGLLELKKNNKVELSGKHLKINGDKQPENIYSKYKRLYEETIGAALTKNSKIELDIIGKSTKRKMRQL